MTKIADTQNWHCDCDQSKYSTCSWLRGRTWRWRMIGRPCIPGFHGRSYRRANPLLPSAWCPTNRCIPVQITAGRVPWSVSACPIDTIWRLPVTAKILNKCNITWILVTAEILKKFKMNWIPVTEMEHVTLHEGLLPINTASVTILRYYCYNPVL